MEVDRFSFLNGIYCVLVTSLLRRNAYGVYYTVMYITPLGSDKLLHLAMDFELF